MSDVRSAYRLLATTGLSFAALGVALVTHALLWWAQQFGFLGGDYDAHAHGSVSVVAAICVAAGLGAVFLYAAHVFAQQRNSLPHLARTCLRALRFRVTMFLALAGTATLYAMESGEQLAAHHFDGPLSAFGGTPAVAFAFLAATALLVVASLRAICAWLADAHERIVRFIAIIARPAGETRDAAFACGRFTGSLVHRPMLAVQGHGERAPPFDLAF